MSLFGLFLMFALMGAVWMVLDTASARDAARRYAARYCQELGVQFLDQTVALSSTRPVRRKGAPFWLLRRFRFEFSESGNDRFPGQVTVLGHQATEIVLEGERIGRVVAGATARTPRDDDSNPT